jgi:hypothetical protein
MGMPGVHGLGFDLGALTAAVAFRAGSSNRGSIRIPSFPKQ